MMEHTILPLRQVPAYEGAVHAYIKRMDEKRRLERFHKHLSNAACVKILLNQPLSLCVVEEGKRIVAFMEIKRINEKIMTVSLSSHTGAKNVMPAFFKKANELYPNVRWGGELNDFCNPVAFRLFRRYITDIFAYGTDGYATTYCPTMNRALPVWSKDSNDHALADIQKTTLAGDLAKQLALANMAAARATWKMNGDSGLIAQMHVYEISQRAKERGVQFWNYLNAKMNGVPLGTGPTRMMRMRNSIVQTD